MSSFYYYLYIQTAVGTIATDGDPVTVYHHAVTESLRLSAAAGAQAKGEIIQKNGSILRGGLIHFLSTPLKSDKDDIIRLIEESIAASIRQLDAAPLVETTVHTLWRVMEPASVPLHRQMVGVVKRLLKNGRSQLASTGVQFGKNAGDITASLFAFDGFATVRTIRGIVDGATNSEPLRAVSGNLLSFVGAGEGNFEEPHRAVIEFDDPDGLMASGIMERCATLGDLFGVRSWTLLRRVLHATGNGEYQIHFGFDAKRSPLGSILLTLIGEDTAFEDAVTSTGALVVLERHTV